MQSATLRATAAVAFAERIHQLAVAQPTTTTSHLAWFLTSKSVAHALSYDARLVPSTVLNVVAEPVVRRTEALAHFIIQRGESDEEQRTQIRLPGCYGGMGLRAEAVG